MAPMGAWVSRTQCRLWAADFRLLSPTCGCSMLYQGGGRMSASARALASPGIVVRH